MLMDERNRDELLWELAEIAASLDEDLFNLYLAFLDELKERQADQ